MRARVCVCVCVCRACVRNCASSICCQSTCHHCNLLLIVFRLNDCMHHSCASSQGCGVLRISACFSVGLHDHILAHVIGSKYAANLSKRMRPVHVLVLDLAPMPHGRGQDHRLSAARQAQRCTSSHLVWRCYSSTHTVGSCVVAHSTAQHHHPRIILVHVRRCGQLCLLLPDLWCVCSS